LPGDIVDGRKVCFTRILRWSADTDEDGVPSTDGFTCVGGIGNFSSLVGGRENLIEVMFVDRHSAGVELCDTLAIDIRANYLVSCFGKTSSGHETHVTTTDD